MTLNLRHRWLQGIAVAVLLVMALSGASLWALNTSYFHNRIEVALSDRLGLQVSIANLNVSLFPHPHLVGSTLVAKLDGGSDTPAFLTLERFSANLGPLSVWRRHVATLQVEGLRVFVPA